MIDFIVIKGRDGHGDLCLVPLSNVNWISRMDKNDCDDIFGTLDGEVYTCDGGWQQAIEIYAFGGGEDEDQNT